jgi:hypothetical protein
MDLMRLAPVKERLKRALAPWLYPRPVPELAPERLYLYLDVLWRLRDHPGAVVEIGCYQCGTAAWAYRMLRDIGSERPYVCVDTFGGFIDDQFERDVASGTAADRRNGFGANSRQLVAGLLASWQCDGIQLIEADIVEMTATMLPEAIAVALVDVDLEVPTLAALEKLYPRLVRGGAILVDDCNEAGPFRGARVAFRRFVAERELPERYTFGMGCIGEVGDPHTVNDRGPVSLER